MDTKALRQKILDLAIRGKLVPQDPNDEPASVLLERIREQKKQMVKDGKLKAKDIKNDTIIFVGEDNLHYEKFQDGSVKCIEDEIPFELPEGWAWTRLGFLGQYKKGPFGSSITKAMFIPDSPTAIKVYEQKNAINKDATLGNYFISTDKYETLKGFEVFPNDIIVSCAGTIGESYVLPSNIRKGIINQALMKITLFDLRLLDFYLVYFDFKLKESAQEHGHGIALKNIPSFDILKQYLVPMPPIDEQIRINKELKELLEKVDVIDLNKKDVREIIKTTKSKVLDLAIRGQLVPQDPNDEPASVLLERIRAEKEELIKAGKIKRDKKASIIFKGEDNSYYEKVGKSISCIEDEIPFYLPDDWEWCRLGSLCTTIQYGLSNSAENSGSHRLLRITDIQNSAVNWNTVPFTTIDDAEKYLLKQGDIVFARTGATVGKSFLINEMPYEAVYASFLIRIRLIDGILPQYIYDFFNSPCYWEQISAKAVGVGQPNCNGATLSNLFIPVPPSKMQYKIAGSIKKIWNYISTVEKGLS